MIPNETARDRRLSFTALGVLVEVLSHHDNWVITADQMARQKGVPVRQMQRAFAELGAAGYRHRLKYPDEHGLWRTEVHFSDIPRASTDVAASVMSVRPVQMQVCPAHADKAVSGASVSDASVSGASVTDASVGATSIRRPTKKTDKKTKRENSLSRAIAQLRAEVPDVTEREIEAIVDQIQANPAIRAAGPYLARAVANGDAAELVAKARAQLTPAAGMTASRAKPPWCGKCSNERTRQVDLPDGRVGRCPDCNPQAGR